MNKSIKLFLSVLLIFQVSGCLNSDTPISTNDGGRNVLESQGNGDFYTGLTSDDVVIAANMLSTTVEKISIKDITQLEVMPTNVCHADVMAQPCIDNKKSISFENCTGKNPETLISGFQTVYFKNDQCLFENPSDGISINFTIKGENVEKGTAAVFDTRPHLNYLNETKGGGEQYAILEKGFAYSSKGKNIILKLPKTTVNYTSSTNGPVFFVPDPNSDSLFINGAFVRNHNLAKYTFKSTFKLVQFNPEVCCHPIGGQLTLEYRDNIQGKASIFFSPTCGEVTIAINDGLSNTHLLRKCR